eukprot:6198685-Pleurochrysis_carterae.AAC.4
MAYRGEVEPEVVADRLSQQHYRTSSISLLTLTDTVENSTGRARPRQFTTAYDKNHAHNNEEVQKTLTRLTFNRAYCGSISMVYSLRQNYIHEATKKRPAAQRRRTGRERGEQARGRIDRSSSASDGCTISRRQSCYLVSDVVARKVVSNAASLVVYVHDAESA